MTLRELVMHTLSWPPYDAGATATQIWHFAQSTGRDVKLSSLSSQLRRMYDDHELNRMEDFGPRGGYGYTLNLKACKVK
jgi:hypothetical protein